MLTNPVVLAVLSLCILCLFKVNVLLSMLISLFIGGVAGGLGVTGTLSSMLGGLGGNGETALAYVLLGTFAACMAYTGITTILSKKVAAVVGENNYIHIFLPVSLPPFLFQLQKIRRLPVMNLSFP